MPFKSYVNNSYDVLNGLVLATGLTYGKSDERVKAKENLDKIKSLNLNFPMISIRDRGYISLRDIYNLNKDGDKYIIRFSETFFKSAISKMHSNDEIIAVKPRRDKLHRYKDIDPEYYDCMQATKARVSFRTVIVDLEDGKKAYLATNLAADEFSYADIKEIYRLRWGIETNYNTLKESLKIESISSSKDELIKQDIYSALVAYNTLQFHVIENEPKINPSKYKHKMKPNMNMAIGFFKKYFIYILIESDAVKLKVLMDKLADAICRHLIPIRPNRKYPIKRSSNKHSITKRKAF